MLNSVALAGNLTRDPQMRTTQGGMAILSMGIAVNDRRKNQQTGEWEDVPQYFELTMFGKRAEAVSKYLSKGTKVAVQGKLHYSSWNTEDGQKRSKVDVTVDELEFMSRRDDGQQQGGYGGNVSPQVAYAAQRAQAATGYDDVSYGVFDEDIPF